MKIAILTSGILPVPAVQSGAVENLVDVLLAYNDKHRLHDITIFTVYHPDVENHPAIRSDVNHYEYIHTQSFIYRLKAKWYSLFHRHECYYFKLEYFFEQVYSRLRRQKYDLIVLENRPGYAIKLKKRLAIPIVSHIHTNQVHEATPQTFEIIRSTTRFLTVSEYIKSEIQNLSPQSDVRVVYNGLDTTLFNKSIAPIRRDTFGFSANDFVAVFCGRLIPNKGIKELLQALLLLKDYPDIKLMVIGNSEFTNGSNHNSFIDELHQMVESLGQRVMFTGFMPYANIPAHLLMADVAVVPSHINEAFGMVCVEACAMGLPVIATNDGGIPETLVGQKHILIDKHIPMPRQIADALLTIKEDTNAYAGNNLNPIFHTDNYAATFFKEIDFLPYF